MKYFIDPVVKFRKEYQSSSRRGLRIRYVGSTILSWRIPWMSCFIDCLSLMYFSSETQFFFTQSFSNILSHFAINLIS